METETKPRSTKRTGRIRRAQALALPLAGLLAFATVALARAQEPRVDLVLDPDGRVGTEELLRLTVTVSSPRGDIGRPGFELDNLRIVSGPSQSTSVQFLNGVSSQSISFSWIVQPEKLGPGRVRSGAIRVGERTISLPERQVEVVENPPARNPMRRQAARDPFSSRDPFESFFDPLGRRGRRPPPPSRPPEIFLEAEISPRRPYVGQQVLYTLFLYTDVTVRSVTPSELPDFKGFWTQVIPQPNNPDLEWVVRDNREIGRIVLLQRALFPRRAGELEIGPVKATMNAMVRDTRPLGSIFPEPHDVQRSTKATTIEVRQLPEPSPDDFRGAVGRMEVAASLEPRELEMGEASTLTLELKGEGHLQGLPEPVLPELPDLQVFPPQQQSDSLLKGTRVHGSRVWSYVLVPQKPGAVELPAISIPYFDPRPGEYRRAEVDTALTLAVRGSTRSARMDGTEVKLHPIRTASLPTLEPAAGPSSPWWHALILVPVAAALVLILLPSRRASEPRGAGGPEGNRRHHGSSGRRAARQHLLRELQEAVADDRPRQTAARVEEAWRGYLSERWNIPTGTASSRWSQLLEAEGVSPAAAEELVQLADDLHYLRYAPKLSSTDDLRRELVERSRRLVKSL